jgi:hypothetical protein
MAKATVRASRKTKLAAAADHASGLEPTPVQTVLEEPAMLDGGDSDRPASNAETSTTAGAFGHGRARACSHAPVNVMQAESWSFGQSSKKLFFVKLSLDGAGPMAIVRSDSR